MHYFISYDIGQNRYRTKTAKILIRHGCVRVQKSVFYLPDALPREVAALGQELKKLLIETESEEDSVLFIPVEDDGMTAVGLVGENISLERAKNPPNVRIF